MTAKVNKLLLFEATKLCSGPLVGFWLAGFFKSIGRLFGFWGFGRDCCWIGWEIGFLFVSSPHALTGVIDRLGDVVLIWEALVIDFLRWELASLGGDGFTWSDEFDVLERDGIVPRVEFSMIDGIEVSDEVGLKNGSDEYWALESRVGDGIESPRANCEFDMTADFSWFIWLKIEFISVAIEETAGISESALDAAAVGVWDREPWDELDDIEIIDWLGLVALSFNALWIQNENSILIFKTKC